MLLQTIRIPQLGGVPIPACRAGDKAGIRPQLRLFRGVHEGDDDPHGTHVEV